MRRVHNASALRQAMMIDEDDDDEMTPMGRAAPVGARDDPATRLKARLSYNMCPICWMPLVLDPLMDMDRKWDVVSATFKGKPAFSIKHPDKSRSVARHVFAFGMNPLAAGKRNYQNCHYVHFSMVGNNDSVNSYWTLYQGFAGNPVPKPVSVHNEVRKFVDAVGDTRLLGFTTPEAFERDFFSRVCVEGGIFKDALARDGAMDQYLHANHNRLNHRGITAVVTFMKTTTFTGCCDCNTSMTLAAFMQSIFELAFTPRMCGRRTRFDANQMDQMKRGMKGLKLENMVHYVMLSGVLYRGDLVAGDDADMGGDAEQRLFLISDLRDRDSWQIRFVLVWCTLQILTCLWKFYAIDAKIAHHKSYVYVAIADFYFSLLFYALHEGLRAGADDRRSSVGFEAFNFFYSSHVPFFIASPQPNLSLCVMRHFDLEEARREFAVPNFDDPEAALTVVRLQVKAIMDASCEFWKLSFEVVSTAVHEGELNPAWHGGARSPQHFFVSPDRVIKMARDLRESDLNVQTFAIALGPAWYWHHFKHITMPRIAKLCKQYDGIVRLLSTPGTRIWRRWYRMFDASVRALQAQTLPGGHVRDFLRSVNEMRVGWYA